MEKSFEQKKEEAKELLDLIELEMKRTLRLIEVKKNKKNNGDWTNYDGELKTIMKNIRKHSVEWTKVSGYHFDN
ncbi:TPA: hypothetical protein QCQ12_003111 [Bacillus cereus biovar anthracis]|nr:hypothetical protein [Bacillus cereus biovar anthracis]